jgi:hypothetical protein
LLDGVQRGRKRSHDAAFVCAVHPIPESWFPKWVCAIWPAPRLAASQQYRNDAPHLVSSAPALEPD